MKFKKNIKKGEKKMNERMKRILNEKMMLDKHDIMELFDCKQARAYSIIRCIKTVSDTMKVAGMVTVADFLRWYNKPLESGDMRIGEYWGEIARKQSPQTTTIVYDNGGV